MLWFVVIERLNEYEGKEKRSGCVYWWECDGGEWWGDEVEREYFGEREMELNKKIR